MRYRPLGHILAARPPSLRAFPPPPLARPLSTDPHRLLGLPRGAPREEIRRRYFELAKKMHPDTRRSEELVADDPSAPFIELHAAFEALMRSAPGASSSAPTAQSTAARGSGGNWARRGGSRPFEPRTATLAEVLARRLEEEPHELHAVWNEIVERRLEVDARAADLLFRACSRASVQDTGMAEALRLLREATALGILSGANRSTALASLLTW